MANEQMRALFKKSKETPPSGGGVYINHAGQFVLEVEELKGTQNFRGISSFIAGFKILESSLPEVHKVGSSASWVAGYDKPSTAGNVHAFFLALLPGQDVDENGMMECIDEVKQPCAGMLIHLETAAILTQAGKPFTKHIWIAVTDEEAAKHGQKN